MILSLIKRLFSGTVYVQLREGRLKICHIEKGVVFDEQPYIAIDKSNPKKEIVSAVGNEAYALKSNPEYEVSNPFSHPRMLVSNFVKAEKVLMHGIHAVHSNRFIAPSPVIIMHPMEKLEGGITDIECRVYRELALGAGGRQVHIHIGNTISTSNFNMEQVCEPGNA